MEALDKAKRLEALDKAKRLEALNAELAAHDPIQLREFSPYDDINWNNFQHQLYNDLRWLGKRIERLELHVSSLPATHVLERHRLAQLKSTTPGRNATPPEGGGCLLRRR